jgi:hypothetical protein
VVANPEQASHVVDLDEEIDSLPTEMAEEYVRTLEVRGQGPEGTALVHWYYMPDSYDEWIPSEHVDGTEPPDTVPLAADRGVGRPWRVCCRFVLDCELFNEWGNEVDYESTADAEAAGEEEEEDSRSPNKSSSGRKQRGRKKYDPAKAKTAPVAEAVAATEKMMPDARPPLLGNKTVVVLNMNGGTDNKVSQEKPAQGDSTATPASSSSSSSAGAGGDGSAGAAAGTKRKASDALETGVTNYAQPAGAVPEWYNQETVSDVEVKYLPEFFAPGLGADGGAQAQSKAVAEYIRIRNFIANLYAQGAQNPAMHLSATDCRKKIAGDVGAILKIHDFLDAFGVINYNVQTDGRPALLPAPFSQWRTGTDAASLASAGVLMSSLGVAAPVGSRVLLTDNGCVTWSDAMDNSLKRAVLAHAGDWAEVATALAAAPEFDSFKPSARDCLARFVALPLGTPAALVVPGATSNSSSSSSGGSSSSSSAMEGIEGCAMAAVASGKPAQRLRFLSSMIADRAAASLGPDAARTVVTSAVEAAQKCVDPTSSELAAPIAVAAAAISAAARVDALAEEARLKELMTDYVSQRLSALEEKVKLLADVERAIDIERERLEVDKRDVQIQRAQTASAVPHL